MGLGRFLASVAVMGGLLAGAPAAHAAADNTLGMALLGAYINSDGSVAWHSGLQDADRIGAGVYSLTFDRDLTYCMIAATPAHSGAAGFAARITSTGASLSVAVNQISDDALTDSAFHVVVFCPR